MSIENASNGIHVSALEHATDFNHSAVVTGIARTYTQRGIAVRSEPPVPGGRRADLAVDFGGNWVYVEVKTRNVRVVKRSRSFRKYVLREMLHLRAHSLKQLPRKESALVVVSTSTSTDRGMASRKIAIARAFEDKFFDDNSNNIIGVMIFAPFHNSKSPTGWSYASAMIVNPKYRNPGENLDNLAAVQL